MKKILILILIPFGAKAQTSDSANIKYLLTQVTILKTMIGLNKAEYINYRTQNEMDKVILNGEIAYLKNRLYFLETDTTFIGNGLKLTVDSTFIKPRKTISIQ